MEQGEGERSRCLWALRLGAPRLGAPRLGAPRPGAPRAWGSEPRAPGASMCSVRLCGLVARGADFLFSPGRSTWVSVTLGNGVICSCFEGRAGTVTAGAEARPLAPPFLPLLCLLLRQSVSLSCVPSLGQVCGTSPGLAPGGSEGRCAHCVPFQGMDPVRDILFSTLKVSFCGSKPCIFKKEL